MIVDRGGGLIGRPKTKIVCTLGPSTESQAQIQSLVESGMSVARLNLSHGTLESHATAIELVRSASDAKQKPVGIMVDVPGSKYRTGPLAPGAIELTPKSRLTLTSDDVIGTEELVSVAPPGIHRDAIVGHPVLLDDGLIQLECVAVRGVEVECVVVSGGRLTERRGRRRTRALSITAVPRSADQGRIGIRRRTRRRFRGAVDGHVGSRHQHRAQDIGRAWLGGQYHLEDRACGGARELR